MVLADGEESLNVFARVDALRPERVFHDTLDRRRDLEVRRLQISCQRVGDGLVRKAELAALGQRLGLCLVPGLRLRRGERAAYTMDIVIVK